ncbi:DUF502 domain-containing protein [Acidaminobacter sp. JC074]|uniref:DUF502 domain-containing protein n=1 Tax=Acidaminobacter sp. JC074 TaxID=2530199 RepID=UPI001F0D7449
MDYFKKIRNKFLQGLLIILPIGITLWIVFKILNFLDLLFGRYLKDFIGYRIPGLGLLITITLIILVGNFASHYIGDRIYRWVQDQLEKLPVIKAIYTPLKDITNNFSNKDSNNFKQVVLVTYPCEGSYSIGFVTKEQTNIADEDMTGVFIPTTPNLTNGFLVFLRKDQYKVLDMPVEEALKTVISLGAVTPDLIKEKE